MEVDEGGAAAGPSGSRQQLQVRPSLGAACTACHQVVGPSSVLTASDLQG